MARLAHMARKRAQFEQTGPCREHTSLMYARPSSRDERLAVALCAGCPVRPACLQHAMDNEERFGVWGGTTERQRSAMRKAARAAA